MGSHLSKKLPEAYCIPHDLLYTAKLESFRNLYYLASYGNMAFHDDIDKIIRANVLDVVNVIKNIDWKNINAFVYVSTSSVNRKVQTVYSRTKRAAEEILLSYAEKYNAPISIVRPLSITGVGEQKEHLIPTLIRSAIEGHKMPFVANAHHDFIDVDDVVSGLLSLAENKATGVFELGTGVSRSNLEVKELVEKVTGRTIFVEPIEKMRSYDSSEWISKNFSISKFGWTAKKPLEQSIKEMVEDYEK